MTLRGSRFKERLEIIIRYVVFLDVIHVKIRHNFLNKAT